MPKSKLTEAERIELFHRIAKRFERRDLEYAQTIEAYLNDIANSSKLSALEIGVLAHSILDFAAELNAALRPFQHSIDWMTFGTRLVSIMLNSAKDVRHMAEKAGVEVDDSEAIGDLRKSAERPEIFGKIH